MKTWFEKRDEVKGYKEKLGRENEKDLIAQAYEDRGEIIAWAHAEGMIIQEFPQSYGEWETAHLVLNGLNNFACDFLPCMFLGQGPGFTDGDRDAFACLRK